MECVEDSLKAEEENQEQDKSEIGSSSEDEGLIFDDSCDFIPASDVEDEINNSNVGVHCQSTNNIPKIEGQAEIAKAEIFQSIQSNGVPDSSTATDPISQHSEVIAEESGESSSGEKWFSPQSNPSDSKSFNSYASLIPPSPESPDQVDILNSTPVAEQLAPRKISFNELCNMTAIDQQESNLNVTMKKENSPAEDSSAEDSPVKDSPAEYSPAKDSPAEYTPAEDYPEEDSPVKDSPAEDSPAKDSPAEDSPAEDSPAEDYPAKDSPAEDSPAKDYPKEDSPEENYPEEDSSEEDYPEEDCTEEDLMKNVTANLSLLRISKPMKLSLSASSKQETDESRNESSFQAASSKSHLHDSWDEEKNSYQLDSFVVADSSIDSPKSKKSGKQYKRVVVASESDSNNSTWGCDVKSDKSYSDDDSSSESLLDDNSTNSSLFDDDADEHSEDQNSSGSFDEHMVQYEAKMNVEEAIEQFVQMICTMPSPDEDDDDQLAYKCPHYLRADLYKHQVYGLKWLRWRENNFPGGGILADEMGLGKTVMIIALVLKGKEDKKKNGKENQPVWHKPDRKSGKLVPSRSTLVVCPAGMLRQWESEIGSKSKNMTVLSFHGPKRQNSAAVLAQFDFVLTTYPTIASEISKDKSHKSPLMRIYWDRVVLDEGHIVRNIKTKAAYAVGALHANHRWVVTGTPVHNSTEDMFSLISFLRLAPFDDKKVWEHWIGWKSSKIKPDCAERLQTIGKCLLLRRTKKEINMTDPSKQIPPKEVVVKEVELSQHERKIYDHLREFAAEKFKNYLKKAQKRQLEQLVSCGGGSSRDTASSDVNFTHIFALILRLRQATVLPYLIHTMLEEEDESFDSDSSVIPEFSEDNLISMKNPCFGKKFKSAKITQLLEDIEAIKFIAEETGEAMDKIVVISQWTQLLEIVNYHLQEAGYSTASITGKQTLEERNDVMNKVNSNSRRPEVLLLSLMAGGVGLNLVGANHVFFMDIHWNPQLGLQAQDRVHRYGQTKKVTVTRYVSKDTIDERVMVLQEQKLDLAAGILNNTKKEAGGGLNINQMRLLFDL